MLCLLELAKSFQECLCCSVAPAHNISPANKSKEDFYADLLVWHVRQVPALGACSPRQKTKRAGGRLCQRKTQPDNKLCLNWGQRQGFGLWRVRKWETWLTMFHRCINKYLPKPGFQALSGAQSSHYLSTVLGILHVFSHFILHKLCLVGEGNLGLRQGNWHGDTANEDKFNQNEQRVALRTTLTLWRKDYWRFAFDFFLPVSEKRWKYTKKKIASRL